MNYYNYVGTYIVVSNYRTFQQQINTYLKKRNIEQMNNYFAFCTTLKFFRFYI